MLFFLSECVNEMLTISPTLTIRQVALTFRGSKAKREVENKGFQHIAHYGSGQQTFKKDAEVMTFIHDLIIKDILDETLSGGIHSTPYIKLGKNAETLKNGNISMLLYKI